MPSIRRPPALLLVALLVPAVLACGPEEPSLRRVADLADLARWGDVLVEPRVLDLGTDDAAAYLGDGWSVAESDAAGRTWVWATGGRSEIRLPIVEPRDLTLTLRGVPFVHPDAPTQSVDLVVAHGGGVGDSDEEPEPVGSFDMTPGLDDYEVRIPASVLRAGENILRLDHAWSLAPSEVTESGDDRPLAAAWHEVRIGGAQAASPDQRVRVDDGKVFLPWNSRLDLYLALPAGASLDAEAWSWRGAGRLDLLVTPDEGADLAAGTDERLVASLTEPPSAPIRLWPGQEQSLVEDSGLPVRVRLRAVADQAAGQGARGDGGVVLAGPVLLAFEADPDAQTDAAPDPVPESVPDSLPAKQPEIPEVFVVYLVDTLRADHLAAWNPAPLPGLQQVPTPALDAFAEESVVFERVVAQSPWTKASVASVFTGRWPPAHGAVDRDDRLPEQIPALAQILQGTGWRTAAFVTNPNVTVDFGFDRGFDHFAYLGEKIDAGRVNDALETWIADDANRRTEGGRPLFLYVHVLEPHSPYDPPDRWREQAAPGTSADFAEGSLDLVNDLRQGRVETTDEILEQLRALYRAEIAFADASFARLRQILDAAGYGDPAILFVSDHGEEFLEHGNLEHGRAMHAESLWVPMALRWPGVAPRRERTHVQHVDVLPTILARLGLKRPPGLAGTDLLAGPIPQRPLYSHLHLDGPERASVVAGGYKAMVELGDPGAAGVKPEIWWRLYDIETDPGETRDLSSERPVRLGFLQSILRRRLARGDEVASSDAVLDDEMRRSLEALGYL